MDSLGDRFGGVLAILGGLGFWLLYVDRLSLFSPRDSVLVTDFENHTGDPRFDEALQTAFVISLRASCSSECFSRGARLDAVLKMMARTQTQTPPAVGREICQRENIRAPRFAASRVPAKNMRSLRN